MSTATSAAGDAFRESVRSWVEANFPPELKDQPASMEGASDGDLAQALERWRDALAGQGWGAPTWPKAYGGAGLTPAEARVISQEIGRAGGYNPIPLMAGMGVTMVGPTLLEYGTDEQKEKHLPGIASGKIRWCLGLSEERWVGSGWPRHQGRG